MTNLQILGGCKYSGLFICTPYPLDAGTTAPVTIQWQVSLQGTTEATGSLTLSGQTSYANEAIAAN